MTIRGPNSKNKEITVGGTISLMRGVFGVPSTEETSAAPVGVIIYGTHFPPGMRGLLDVSRGNWQVISVMEVMVTLEQGSPSTVIVIKLASPGKCSFIPRVTTPV